MEGVKISAPALQASPSRLGAMSAPPGAPEAPQDTFVPSPPQDPAPRLAPARAEAPPEATGSARRKAMALGALALVGLGVAAGTTPGPATPVTYVCSEGKVLTTLERDPSLVGSLLDRLNGAELSPTARLILQCEGVDRPSELKDPGHRADLAWEALLTNMGGDVGSLRDRRDFGGLTAWPYGQAMAASLDRAKLSGDYTEFYQMVDGLEAFRSAEGGYNPGKGGGDRYFDDNAWIGLVFMQAHQQVPDAAKQAEFLKKAEDVFSFLETGMSDSGGILWKENAQRPTFNTCALGPTAELALRLHEATGEGRYLEVAQRMDRFMDQNLRQPSGLYVDHVTTDLAQKSDTVYSYNQGTPIGVKVLLYRATGDAGYLSQARQTADAALAHFGTEGLWKQSPAFNAVFFRNLLTLDSSYKGALEDYLSQVWSQGLDGRTGLLNGGGIGSYEQGKTTMIDQAGLVQLYSLLGWPAADLGSVT